jgi:hypothetical protein
MSKKTAIEWLVANIDWQLIKNTSLHYEMIVKKAKEMEREQIKKAWIDGNYNIDLKGNPSENYAISDENYYKQTFKSE